VYRNIKKNIKNTRYFDSYLGDAYGAGIVAHLSQGDLREMDAELSAENAHRVEEGFENFTGKNTDSPPNMNIYTGLTAM